jgi:hypothetical protein
MSPFHIHSRAAARTSPTEAPSAASASPPQMPQATPDRRERHPGFVGRLRTFVQPDRRLPACPAPVQPMSVGMALSRLRGMPPSFREAPDSTNLLEMARILTDTLTSDLHSILAEVPDDTRRAMLVNELTRLHDGAWRKPPGRSFDPAAAWIERLGTVPPARAHDIVSHIVALVPDSQARMWEHATFDAFADIRDPEQRADVAAQIARFPHEGRAGLDALIRAVAAVKATRRASVLERAHALGWDGSGEAGWPQALVALSRVPPHQHAELVSAVGALPRAPAWNIWHPPREVAPTGHVLHALCEVPRGARERVAAACAVACRRGTFGGERAVRVVQALARVKVDLRGVAACVGNLCPQAMDGEGVSQVVAAVSRLPAAHREATVELLVRVFPDNTTLDHIFDLLKEIGHLVDTAHDCLPAMRRLADDFLSVDDLLHFLAAARRVPRQRRGPTLDAAVALFAGEARRDEWPHIIRDVADAAHDDSTLATVVEQACQFASLLSAAQRLELLRVLVGIRDPQERADYVRLGESLRPAAISLMGLRPLQELAQTPASERADLMAHVGRLAAPGRCAEADAAYDAAVRALNWPRMATAAMGSVTAWAVGALRRVREPEREGLTDQLMRLFGEGGGGMYLKNVADILLPVGDILVGLQPPARQALVDFVVGILPAGGDVTARARLIEYLARLPEEQRDEATTACATLRAVSPASRAIRYIETVLSTPAGARTERAQALRRALAPSPYRVRQRGAAPAAAADPRTETARFHAARQHENVMDSVKIARITDSWEHLSRLYPQAPPRGSRLDRFETWLATYPERATEAQKAVFARVRGGDTEAENALRTLKEPMDIGDYSQPLRMNEPFQLATGQYIGVGDVFERVLFAIERLAELKATPEQMEQVEHDPEQVEYMKKQVEREKDLGFYSAFIAVSQCIDDDWHRVCDVGFLQRCFIILQGRVPGVFIDDEVPKVTPQDMVTFVTGRLRQRWGDHEPPLHALRGFFDENVAAARALYGQGSAEAGVVETHLDDYLTFEFDAWRNRQRADGPAASGSSS